MSADGGPGRDEYEGDRAKDGHRRAQEAEGLRQDAQVLAYDAEELEKRVTKFEKQDKLMKGILLMACVLAALSVANTVMQQNDLKTACKSRNEVRGLLTGRINDDIKSTKESDPKLFPDIPPAKFEKLVERRLKVLRAQRRGAQPDDCSDVGASIG